MCDILWKFTYIILQKQNSIPLGIQMHFNKNIFPKIKKYAFQIGFNDKKIISVGKN